MSSKRFFRIAKEGSWIVIGQIATVIASLVLVRVLTDKLSPSEYGQLSLGLTLTGMIGQVIMGGIGNGISRFYSLAAEKQDIHDYLSASSRLVIYGTVLILIIGLLLLTGLYYLEYLEWMKLAAAALIFSLLSTYNSFLSGIQNAARQRIIVAFHGGLDSWLKIPLALAIMLWLGNTSVAIIIGYALTSLLVTFSQLIFLERLLKKQKNQSTSANQWLNKIWQYAWPFSTFGAFTWLQQISDRWALETFASTSDVGLYSVLFQLGYTPISIALGIIMSLLAPILYQRSGDSSDHNRNKNVQRIISRITITGLLVTIMAFFIAMALHQWIFALFVANQFRVVSYLLPWVILAGGLFAVGQILSLKLMSDINTKSMIIPKILTAIIGITCNIYGAKLAGLQGVVAGLIIFSLIYFLWMIYLNFPVLKSSQTIT